MGAMPTPQNDVSASGFSAARVCIPNPEEHPTITIPDAARLAGVAKRTGYDAAQRGEWPVIRVGRAVRVRTRQFLELYGFTEDAA